MSERSAPDLVLAVDAMALPAQDDRRFIIRSVRQIEALDSDQLQAVLDDSDVVVLLAVFGEKVEALASALGSLPISTDVYGLGGDPRLTRATRVGGVTLFHESSGENLSDVTEAVSEALLTGDSSIASDPRFESRPALARWATLSGYWQGRGNENLRHLLENVSASDRPVSTWEAVRAVPSIRWWRSGKLFSTPEAILRKSIEDYVVVVDYESGTRAVDLPVLEEICESIERRDVECLGLLARWGRSSAEGLKQLESVSDRLRGIVILQDFVIGGGDAREDATAALVRLGVPVFKAVRVRDRDRASWAHSSDGLTSNAVHYQIGMPEVQGIGQPHVVAVASSERRDGVTGAAYRELETVSEEIDALARRVTRWKALQEKPNAKKRVALIYYNHPPGRHNIGADNLDVPRSLLEILRTLRSAGYKTGELPKSHEALLKEIQARGVNLPENAEELATLAQASERGKAGAYQRWFEKQSPSVSLVMSRGPLAALQYEVLSLGAEAEVDPVWKTRRIDRTLSDVRSLLDGARHPARPRALDLLQQLERAYATPLTQATRDETLAQIEKLTRAIEKTGIEGIRGWGAPPGDVMTSGGRFVLPGIEFGNVFIAPQPPRGWELHDELLHANVSFPPPHQYLEFYRWLREDWKADAIVHVGRHSTYEFLPGPAVALGVNTFPHLVIGDLPSVYLYIVDGVGEGTQAKRRGHAVIVDHLTPSMQSTPLYDDLLEIRQLIESFEAAPADSPGRREAVSKILERIDRLNLRGELEASMAEELAVRGATLETADADLLVHEVGHYLTELQERFMSFGLHVFGQDWKPEAIDRMLASMKSGREVTPATEASWRRALTASPRAERDGLLRALNGNFIAPGPGNDPIRSPEVLPTGRNFHGLDGRHLPTRVAYALGRDLADEAENAPGRASRPEKNLKGKKTVILWASDTVRDEGVMIAFGLAKLGMRPLWTERGLVSGVERLPITEGAVREDVVFVTSGLFRDLFANLMDTLDRAALLALDASSLRIAREYPELASALETALEPLGAARAPSDESLSLNRVAANWVRDTRTLAEASGTSLEAAGRSASIRIFGVPPGRYGAGVNRAVERSGSWKDRTELARLYARRMSFGYRGSRGGEHEQAAFDLHLASIDETYHGRASHLYGLLDNNDGFDYLGGLSLAVEAARGEPPSAYVVDHANPDRASVRPLERALLMELRGTHLNPVRLASLMEHGYAGARTMNHAFVENLWGWQATNPDLVKTWVWDEVHEVFFEDRHGIGLGNFLSQAENAPVQINMTAILLVAAQRQFWQADEETLVSLSERMADLIAEHGLPGSGHTEPNHPVFEFVAERLDPERRARLKDALDRARVEPAQSGDGLSTLREVRAEDASQSAEADPAPDEGAGNARHVLVWIAFVILGAFAAGLVRGARGRR